MIVDCFLKWNWVFGYLEFSVLIRFFRIWGKFSFFLWGLYVVLSWVDNSRLLIKLLRCLVFNSVLWMRCFDFFGGKFCCWKVFSIRCMEVIGDFSLWVIESKKLCCCWAVFIFLL